MTKQLLPGRALDALVAERVMGWIRITKPHEIAGANGEPAGLRPIGGGYAEFAIVPNYSTDIAAAWQVVERLNLLNDYVLYRFHSGRYAVCHPEPLDDYVQADTAPLAICLAALRATEAPR